MRQLLMTLLALALLIAPCCAQLPNDRGISKEFTNWDVAWNASNVQEKRNFTWIEKARSQRWDAPDAPFSAAKANVERMFANRKDHEAIEQELLLQAANNPSAVNNFAWGHAARLRLDLKETSSFYQSRLASEQMNVTFTPSFEYVRLQFLMTDAIHFRGTLLTPIGERLIQHWPDDEKIISRQIGLLENLPTLAARERVLQLVNQRIEDNPQLAKHWVTLGYIYKHWSWWNDNLADTPASKGADAVEFYQYRWVSDVAEVLPTPAQRKQAQLYAKRDAALALAAYQRSLQLARSQSEWALISGPTVVKKLEDWIKNNP